MNRSKPVTYTLQAIADLEQIHDYIAEQSPLNAATFLDQIQTRTGQLYHMQEMGRLREDLAPLVRSLVVGKYIAFYRIQHSSVEILRILQGSRDIDALWEKE